MTSHVMYSHKEHYNVELDITNCSIEIVNVQETDVAFYECVYAATDNSAGEWNHVAWLKLNTAFSEYHGIYENYKMRFGFSESCFCLSK